jgi:hypothetical protein
LQWCVCWGGSGGRAGASGAMCILPGCILHPACALRLVVGGCGLQSLHRSGRAGCGTCRAGVTWPGCGCVVAAAWWQRHMPQGAGCTRRCVHGCAGGSPMVQCSLAFGYISLFVWEHCITRQQHVLCLLSLPLQCLVASAVAGLLRRHRLRAPTCSPCGPPVHARRSSRRSATVHLCCMPHMAQHSVGPGTA